VTVVHFAGISIHIDNLLLQRCAWCGIVLIAYDLERIAVPEGTDPKPATWPVGALVEVDGGATSIVEHVAGNPLPANTCVRSLERQLFVFNPIREPTEFELEMDKVITELLKTDPA
jgi:hypothetical protein